MKTKIEELKRLAEAATPGPWFAAISSNMNNSVHVSMGIICDTGKNIDDAAFIAAANPAAVLELIAEVERVTKQREELLAALKGARDSIAGWGEYAPVYFQEKHGLVKELYDLDEFIAKAEG